MALRHHSIPTGVCGAGPSDACDAVTARDADDDDAARAKVRDQRQPHCAGGPPDDGRRSGGQRPVTNQASRGERRVRERRAVVESDAIGKTRKARRRGGQIRGARSWNRRPAHARAGREPGARRRVHDDARPLNARIVGKRHPDCVRSRSHERLHVVQADGLDAHADLACGERC